MSEKKCNHLIIIFLTKKEVTKGIAQFKYKDTINLYRCKSCDRIFTLDEYFEWSEEA